MKLILNIKLIIQKKNNIKKKFLKYLKIIFPKNSE